jgi:hypothetical protein
MSSLLLGPVLEELVSILPRQGLELNLETLAASLLIGSMSLDAETDVTVTATQHGATQVRERQSARNRLVVTGVNTRPRRDPVADLKKLEEALLAFAAIENVTLVAAVRSDGVIHKSRGTGNAELLGRFGMLALRMLGRGGRLRSYYLEHDRGSLFLFPSNDHALLLVGSPELNIGTVFTTFSELPGIKEEP